MLFALAKPAEFHLAEVEEEKAIRTIARILTLTVFLGASATSAETDDEQTFKLCTPSNTVWPTFGTSDGAMIKSISAHIEERLQNAGIWTQSQDGKVRNMLAFKVTAEPSERRVYVLEAMYFKMVVLLPMAVRLLEPGGSLSPRRMDTGVHLARTWARMEFGQMTGEAKLLAHVDRMVDLFIKDYQRAQRTDSCLWLRNPDAE